MATLSARETVIAAFSDSAEMEGNEPHFVEALNRYRDEVRAELIATLRAKADEGTDGALMGYVYAADFLEREAER